MPCKVSGQSTPECSGTWTKFFDQNNVDDTGDSETFRDLNNAFPGQICPSPSAVDAQVVETDRDYRTSGQVVQVDTSSGLLCLNEQQSNGRCLDYRVRFCCPSKKHESIFKIKK